MRVLVGFLFSLCCISACDQAPQAETKKWYQPDINTTWQWQLSDSPNLKYDVDLYDLDLIDTPPQAIEALQERGKKVICYFSAGSYEDWRPDAGIFPKEALGKPLDEWEGERWLDVRLEKVRYLMLKRLDLAQQKGCDGVEPDNIDGYSNDSGFPLTAMDQLSYNRFLAQAAHRRGLAIGLKNDVEQVKELVNDFDFAINEQCFEYQECDQLKPFIEQGKPVFNAEYQTKLVNDSEATKQLCKQANKLQFKTLILPINLDDSLRISCF